MKRYTTGLIAVLALAACTTTPAPQPPHEPAPSGQVGVQDLSASVASSARMQLSANEHFLPPLPEPENRPPAYPKPLLAQRLPPQVVCLRVSIDETGIVTSSAPLQQLPDCEPPAPAPYVDAAQAAAAHWRFDPALRCVFDQGERPAHQTCEGAREIPQALSLTYRFVFEQQDGHGTVRLAP